MCTMCDLRRHSHRSEPCDVVLVLVLDPGGLVDKWKERVVGYYVVGWV